MSQQFKIPADDSLRFKLDCTALRESRVWHNLEDTDLELFLAWIEVGPEVIAEQFPGNSGMKVQMEISKQIVDSLHRVDENIHCFREGLLPNFYCVNSDIIRKQVLEDIQGYLQNRVGYDPNCFTSKDSEENEPVQMMLGTWNVDSQGRILCNPTPHASVSTKEVDNVTTEVIFSQPIKKTKFHPQEDLFIKEPSQVSKEPDKNYNKILVLSDLHIPYVDMDSINIALEEDGDADTLVLLGDIFDEPQHSKFGHDGTVTTKDSIAMGKVLLDQLSPLFKSIFLVEGNHDTRMDLRARQVIPGVKIYSAFEQLILDEDEFGLPILRYSNVKRSYNIPIKRSPLPRNRIITSLTDNEYDSSKGCCSFQVIGDALFCHGYKALKNPGATTVEIIKEWIPRMRAEYELPEISCIVQAHTHKLSKLALNNILGIECGSLGAHHSYEEKYHNYAHNGYAVIYQDKNGITDWNKSTFKFIKEQN